MDAANPARGRTQYLTFFIAGEEYAFHITQVREVVEFGAITRVPAVPASIRGVINLRGNVLPVIDLAVKFGLPESVVTKRSCVVVVETAADGEPVVLGVLVDAVSQVLELGADEIEAPPAFGAPLRVEFLRGMGKVGDKFALILDIDGLLSTQERVAAAASQGGVVP